jgi:hypothetical protein
MFSSGTSRGPTIDVFMLMVGSPEPSATTPPVLTENEALSLDTNYKLSSEIEGIMDSQKIKNASTSCRRKVDNYDTPFEIKCR